MVITDKNKNARENRVDIPAAEEIQKYALVFDALYGLVETMLHKIRQGRCEPFLMILITAASDDLEDILNGQRRPTDILVKIENVPDHYVLICQDTNVEGGFSFSERLLRYLKTGFSESIYMIAMDIRSGRYSAEEIIFEMLDVFSDAVQKEREGEVVLRSLK